MHTFRADIEAANDNRTAKLWRWALGSLAALLVIGTVVYFQVKKYLFEGLPPLPNEATMWEMNLKPNLTIKDKDGNVLDHRGPYVGRRLSLDEMPPYLPNAFLAIEDERFYEHSGVDRKAILRAMFENTKAGNTRQGGSTLTQQIIKNMLLTPERSYRRKFQEAWLAYEMEQVLSKDEILELYLNRVDLGNRSFGVEAASQRYFGKSARDVTMAEAALLAGLPKAPSRYDPTRNFEQAWIRSKLVLQRMLTNNFISLTELSEAETNPPTIAAATERNIDSALVGHMFDMVTERARELVGHKAKDLVIYTTLDPRLQTQAHKAMDAVIERNAKSRKVSEGAVVLIENDTGAIRVMVGGRDYSKSQFNRATQAKRQPGSSFKAFVYAAALEEGFTPGTIRIDSPVNINGWQPENYTERFMGPMTVREALKHSINTIAAQVGSEVGPSKIGALATRLGIKTEMKAHNAIALGAVEVTLMDMTSAFMVFANDGLRRRPYYISSIENSQGEELYRHNLITPERVYYAKYAKQMASMMRDVVETGTGYGARIKGREVAGKTGTTQDYRDAWFVGFSNSYTAGIWMGNDNNSAMNKVTGGLLPVDAWRAFMRVAHKDIKNVPVTEDDPSLTDPDAIAKQTYYKGLIEALVRERNLASGIDVPEKNKSDAANTTGAVSTPGVQ